MTDEQIFNGLLEAYNLGDLTDISSAECTHSGFCSSCPADLVCRFLAENNYNTFQTNLKAFHKRYTQKYYPEHLI